jgi:hypothetical protein
MKRIIFKNFVISFKIFNTTDESYIISELKVVIYTSTVSTGASGGAVG